MKEVKGEYTNPVEYVKYFEAFDGTPFYTCIGLCDVGNEAAINAKNEKAKKNCKEYEESAAAAFLKRLWDKKVVQKMSIPDCIMELLECSPWNEDYITYLFTPIEEADITDFNGWILASHCDSSSLKNKVLELDKKYILIYSREDQHCFFATAEDIECLFTKYFSLLQMKINDPNAGLNNNYTWDENNGEWVETPKENK